MARDEQEIIEFPWVVLDVASLSTCECRQLYIKPENTPITSFCTELTGITEEMLQNGVSFAEAVREFTDFVETRYEAGSFVLCAHGKWDLSQLRYEAFQKGVELRPWMHKYIDLRSVFRYWAKVKKKNLRGTSLQNMCDALGITLTGRLHSGIDDATTIANCLAEVIRIAIEESPGSHATFPAAESWLEAKKTLEASGSRQLILSGLPYDASMEDVSSWLSALFDRIHSQNLVSVSQQNMEEPGTRSSGSCVETSNSSSLPEQAVRPDQGGDGEAAADSSVSCVETLDFFSLPEQVVRAECIMDPIRMRPSGRGLVEFKHPAYCLAAFICIPPPMLQRAVVLSIPQQESENIDTLGRKPFFPSRSQFVAAKGKTCYFEHLPFSIGEGHIRKFVESAVVCGEEGKSDSKSDSKDHSFIENIQVCSIKGSSPPRYTGTCFVSMGSHQDATALIDCSEKNTIDGRFIKISPCWDGDIKHVSRTCCDVSKFSVVMELIVPAEAVGSLIGKGGKNIKYLQGMFPEVRIQGPRRNAPPIFRIQGVSEEVVKAALDALEYRVHEWKVKWKP